MHFRHGYGQPYFAHVAWAVIVDAVAVSLWLRVVSGLYLWARQQRHRVDGRVALASGVALFALLAVLLCL